MAPQINDQKVPCASAGDSVVNVTDRRLVSQNRLVKVRKFPKATVADMYNHLKPILKRHPEFLIWILAPVTHQNIGLMK